jgi:hypothetical protein
MRRIAASPVPRLSRSTLDKPRRASESGVARRVEASCQGGKDRGEVGVEGTRTQRRGHPPLGLAARDFHTVLPNVHIRPSSRGHT